MLTWKEVFIQHHMLDINKSTGLYVNRKEILQDKHGLLYRKHVWQTHVKLVNIFCCASRSTLFASTLQQQNLEWRHTWKQLCQFSFSGAAWDSTHKYSVWYQSPIFGSVVVIVGNTVALQMGNMRVGGNEIHRRGWGWRGSRSLCSARACWRLQSCNHISYCPRLSILI